MTSTSICSRTVLNRRPNSDTLGLVMVGLAICGFIANADRPKHQLIQIGMAHELGVDLNDIALKSEQ